MALAATDNGEDEPLVEESERSKITLKDLWLDVSILEFESRRCL
jgi:hypothetical protein